MRNKLLPCFQHLPPGTQHSQPRSWPKWGAASQIRKDRKCAIYQKRVTIDARKVSL